MRIDLKDVDIYYGDFLAVEGVTLAIPPRAVTAFIGPSGCGKSTVLRTLNRLHELVPGARVEGQVLLDGEDIYAPHVDPTWVRRTVGMVFQRPSPFPTMSVRENVVAGLLLRDGHQDRSYLDEVVEETLRLTHLWDEVADRLDAPGADLSGGQQQRLCIARALANRPQVLLMDEPCSALDPVSTQAIEDLIAKFKRDYTLVIVTHNMAQAARVSDQTAFFNVTRAGGPGRMIEVGDTASLFAHPRHVSTEDYIRRTPIALKVPEGSSTALRSWSMTRTSSPAAAPTSPSPPKLHEPEDVSSASRRRIPLAGPGLRGVVIAAG